MSPATDEDAALPPGVDAVVIGSGPNGLVAANLLADRGWSVVVLEAAAEPGGCVRSAALTAPGFTSDLFSSFYPMAAASPVMRSLRLEGHGLRWSHAPRVLAHPTPAGAVVLSRDAAETAERLERHAAGDGASWLRFVERWQRLEEELLGAMMRPFPPVRAGARLARRAGIDELAWLGRLALAPVRTFAREEFRSEQAAMLLAGNALHADFTLESAGSALFGVLMTALGQTHGFPVPAGGSGALTGALLQRLSSRAGRVACNRPVVEVDIRDGRATGVRTARGERVEAARAVVADVVVTKLFGDLVPRDDLPWRWRDGLARFRPGWATVKLDWALRGPIPWQDEGLRGAGVVHLGLDLDEMSRFARQVSAGWIPAEPFLLVGSMTTADPTRSPGGTEAAWAYTHVPQDVTGDAGHDGLTGRWDPDEVARFADRVEQRIERLAPGFGDSIIARHVLAPADLERENPSLVGGAINEGTAQLHQELVLRPVPGLGRAETPVAGLYLASASAHPGGGVHGAPGANAARAALAHDRLRRVGRALTPRLSREATP